MDLIEFKLVVLTFWIGFAAAALGTMFGLTWLSDWRARRQADREIETNRRAQAVEGPAPAAAPPQPPQKKAA